MSTVMIMILFGSIGFLSSIIYVAISYWRRKESLVSLRNEVNEAERDLSEDLSAIGMDELQQTEAGREILSLRNVIQGRDMPTHAPEPNKPIANKRIIEEKRDTHNYLALINLPVMATVPAGGFGPTGYGSNTRSFVEISTMLIEGKAHSVYSLSRNHYLMPNSYYACVRVHGNSMNRAQPVPIENDDYVLIQSQPEVEHGDIVLAGITGIDERATLKRVLFHEGKILLQPESSDLEYQHPIQWENEFQMTDESFMIVGVVVAVFKPV